MGKQEISFPNRRIAYRDLDRPEEGNETFSNPININVVGPLYQAKHLSSNVPQECSRKFKNTWTPTSATLTKTRICSFVIFVMFRSKINQPLCSILEAEGTKMLYMMQKKTLKMM